MVLKVFLVTSHGRQSLQVESNERVIDLLNRYNIPWSAVSIYKVPANGSPPALYPCLDLHLNAIPDATELLLYFNRNINPSIFSINNFKIVDTSEQGEEATEYFYQDLNNAASKVDTYLKKLCPEECREIIAERVGETIRKALPENSDLVVGVSGGGDSNALLYGLSKIQDYGLKVHPVIIKGIPDWDKGVERAQALCDSYNLPLKIMEETEVKQLLNIPVDSVDLITRFEKEFKGDDFEFLGTLLIRLALSKYARDIGTSFIATGLNLEDVLCESMYRVTSGMKPAPFPSRVIGENTLILPLWLCPKRIIDGCFPKYSLDNYEARYPCFSLGRNLYYSLVYTMQSQFPGYPERLARGLSDISMQDPVTYTYDKDLGFHVERFVPLELRLKFKKLIS